jgi:Ca-activated chloride channel homolog
MGGCHPPRLTEMPIRFDYPIFLALLPLVAAALILTRQRVLSLWGWRRDLSGALRLLAASGFALALAQPSLHVPDDAASVVIAVDESASMSPAALRAAQAWIDQSLHTRRGADRIGLVAFGGDVRVVQPLTADDTPPRLPDPASLQPGATDLAEALRVSAGLVRGASNARLVLLSDGVATSGDLDAALRQAGDIPVDVVPLARPPAGPEVQVESVAGPPYVRAGETFDGTVLIDATEPGPAHLQVSIDGAIATEQDVQLIAGQNRIGISPTVTAEGFHPIGVRVIADRDTDARNNVGFSYVVVKPKPRVLIVEEREKEGASIQETLKRTQMNVDVRPPEALGTLPRLNDYAAIVLNSVAATSFTLDQQKTLQTYVNTNGHGLVTLGGLTSYALGGYADTLLEDILPVLAKPPEKREGAQIALLLVIDRSASMAIETPGEGVSKMSMAKEAAILAASALNPKDTIGVLAFDKKSDWIVRPGVIEQIGLPSIEDRISSLQAEGGTDIYQALREGEDVMRAVPADLKHMVLVSDGRGTEVKYDDLMARMRQDKIGLSAVAIGDDADTDLMPKLARLAQGRYYFTEKIRELPRIITQEAALAKRAALVEGHIQPQFVTSSPILRGIAPNQIPALTGHIATTARDSAEVILTSDEGAPLLAQWHYGLGRAVAWTSDLGTRWTSAWLNWDQNTRFWEQLLRWVMGPPVNRDFRIDITRTGNVAHVRAEDIQDGRFGDLQPLSMTVTPPGGGAVPAPASLRQVAPGQYEASVVADAPGAYQVTITEPSAPRNPGRAETNGFVVPPVAETVAFVPNEAGLRRIASETGGLLLDGQPGDLYQGQRNAGAARWDPIWQVFLVLALCAFVFDVAVRRLRPTTLRALLGRAPSKG